MAKGDKKGDETEGEKLSNKKYVKEMRKLQEQLCYLQDWVKRENERIIIVS